MSAMFTLDEVINSVGGTVLYNTVEPVFTTAVDITGVSTDTRTIKPGEVYFALKGIKDGHDYCKQAIEKGAAAIVVSDRNKVPGGACAIVVNDTIEALGQLARHYRFKLNAKVICITGSVGKTSTREMISEVLSNTFKVWATPSNQNNEIGLPKSILSAPADTEVLVLELGMRGLGEIRYLSKIACPDIAVITNVGYSHIERLGSRENIRKAKMEIAEGLVDDGVLIVNGDDSFLFEYAKATLPINHLIGAVSVDHSGDEKKQLNCPLFFSGKNIKFDETGMTFDIETRRINQCRLFPGFRLNLYGIHTVRNAMFACICHSILVNGRQVFEPVSEARADYEMNKIKETLAAHKNIDGRGAVYNTKRYIVINDAYNAAPESMETAFLNLSIIGKGRRMVLALGNMLELGDFAPELHESVGRYCAGYAFDRVFIVGENAEDFIRGAHAVNPDLQIVKCDDTSDVRGKLLDYVEDGDALLFKASHAFGFEDLAFEFIEKGNA